MLLLVGSYVGPQVYAAEAVMRSYAQKPTKALLDLFRAHVSEEDKAEVFQKSALASVTLQDVAAVMASKGLRLTTEQKKYCERLSVRPYAEAVAGSGKTTLGAAILHALARQWNAVKAGADDGLRRVAAWLTPSRSQRDAALLVLRRTARDPLSVVAVGRPASVSEDGEFHFDQYVEEALRRELAPMYAKVDLIKDQLASVGASGNDFKNLVVEFYALQAKLVQAKQELLFGKMNNVDIVCMTVDAFNQLHSSSSPLAKLAACLRQIRSCFAAIGSREASEGTGFRGGDLRLT